MVKCMHCMRYFVNNTKGSEENEYIRCPYCGELIKIEDNSAKNGRQNSAHS